MSAEASRGWTGRKGLTTDPGTWMVSVSKPSHPPSHPRVWMIYFQRLPSEFMLCFIRLLMTNSAARKKWLLYLCCGIWHLKRSRKFQCFYLASYKIWSVYGPNYLILYCKSVLEEILTDLHPSIEGLRYFSPFFLSSSGVSDGGRSLKVEEAVQRPPKVPPTLPT